MSFSHSKMTPDISSAIVNCGLYEIYKSSAWKYIKHSEIITITKRQISLSQMNQLTSIVPGTEQGLNEINDADPSENMILIDLNDIYNAFHLIFNSNYYFFFSFSSIQRDRAQCTLKRDQPLTKKICTSIHSIILLSSLLKTYERIIADRLIAQFSAHHVIQDH